jgi:hypothetical protein
MTLRSAQLVDDESPQSAQRTQRKQGHRAIVYDLTMNSRTTPDAVQTQDLRPHRLHILLPMTLRALR